MTEMGRLEGKTYVFDFGIAETVDQLPAIASDLVRRNADVIVASGTPAVLPARASTNVIPVVIVAALDPIAAGVVTSCSTRLLHLSGWSKA